MTKTCAKCHIEQSVEEFSLRSWGSRNNACKGCVRENSKNWYKNNKARHRINGKVSYRSWKARAKKERVEIVNTLKNKPCMDCGSSHPPWVMEFDHREGEKKVDNIATMVHEVRNMEAILKEISKCDIVCSNCHRNRTHLRRSRNVSN